jgi:hypothetical protein
MERVTGIEPASKVWEQLDWGGSMRLVTESVQTIKLAQCNLLAVLFHVGVHTVGRRCGDAFRCLVTTDDLVRWEPRGSPGGSTGCHTPPNRAGCWCRPSQRPCPPGEGAFRFAGCGTAFADVAPLTERRPGLRQSVRAMTCRNIERRLIDVVQCRVARAVLDLYRAMRGNRYVTRPRGEYPKVVPWLGERVHAVRAELGSGTG